MMRRRCSGTRSLLALALLATALAWVIVAVLVHGSARTHRHCCDWQVEHRAAGDVGVDHCVVRDFLSPSKTGVRADGNEAITLALHSSIDYALMLGNQALSWQDPISYAVFLPRGSEHAVSLLARYHACVPEVRAKVHVHLVWLRGVFESVCDAEQLRAVLLAAGPTDCSVFGVAQARVELRALESSMNVYPINVMRNEARRGAPTRLHLVADMETHFSPGFADRVRPLAQGLLNGQLAKTVLVYRRFELNPEVRFPETVKQLKMLFDNGSIIQFHSRFYWPGHTIPDLPAWFQYSLTEFALGYTNVPYKRKEWEPQFVMAADDPMHLEIIPTRVYDHQTLCHELCRAGYRFLVLSHVYNVHSGIKRKLSPWEDVVSKSGRKRSAVVLRRFLQLLDAKYPDTKNSCPSILPTIVRSPSVKN